MDEDADVASAFDTKDLTERQYTPQAMAPPTTVSSCPHVLIQRAFYLKSPEPPFLAVLVRGIPYDILHINSDDSALSLLI